MAVGEHEPVAVGPDGVLGIESHDAIPDRVDQRRERHGRAGMSGLGLLDRVHRKSADGIDAELIDLAPVTVQMYGALMVLVVGAVMGAAQASSASSPGASQAAPNDFHGDVLRLELAGKAPDQGLLAQTEAQAAAQRRCRVPVRRFGQWDYETGSRHQD